VWFQVVNPWTRPEREASWVLTRGEHVTRSILIVLLMGLVSIGALLAKRNMLMGRGDRRGAFRLALVLTALGAGSAFLGAHHVADPTLEILLLARTGSFALLISTLVWLFYLALEPYVRRLRPWTLVSWTRLLNGGFRDAVVGRDLLIGMVWGGAAALGFPLLARAPGWFGLPGPPPQSMLSDTLLGLRPLLSFVLAMPVSATLAGLSLLLLFLVLRFVTRRDLAAGILVVAILLAVKLTDPSDTLLLSTCFYALLHGSYVLVLLRVGVLASIAGLCTADLLGGLPHSLDVGSWTGSATLVIVPLLLALAIYAYRSATGGHLGLHRFVATEPSSSRPS
jgi:serine/threonine-protein kinase